MSIIKAVYCSIYIYTGMAWMDDEIVCKRTFNRYIWAKLNEILVMDFYKIFSTASFSITYQFFYIPYFVLRCKCSQWKIHKEKSTKCINKKCGLLYIILVQNFQHNRLSLPFDCWVFESTSKWVDRCTH